MGNFRTLNWLQPRFVARAAVPLAFAMSALALPAAASADVGPYAKVLDARGAVVEQFGAFYGADPGTQIQAAMNYAQCRILPQSADPRAPRRCVGAAATQLPVYPKVVLEPGTYHLLRPFGEVTPKCYGIFVHAGVTLEGATGTVIENAITGSNPCAMSTPTRLISVMFAGTDPANIFTGGRSLHISRLRINASYGADFGIDAAAISGTDISIDRVTVSRPNGAGLLVGHDGRPVAGRSGSPATVTNNVVEDSGGDGIILGGDWITASGNTVTNAADHGMTIYQPFGANGNEISGNTIRNASYGVSLDGSDVDPSDGHDAKGEGNHVYNNTINSVCLGVISFRQVRANIAGNYIGAPRQVSACAGTIFGTTVGIGIQSSHTNVAWANQTWDYRRGIWINDTGLSPGGLGTVLNYIGVVESWGQPWPWPTSGNWINGAEIGMLVESYIPNPVHNGNAFIGNVVSGAGTACSYGNDQVASGNTPASCDR